MADEKFTNWHAIQADDLAMRAEIRLLRTALGEIASSTGGFVRSPDGVDFCVEHFAKATLLGIPTVGPAPTPAKPPQPK